MKTTITMEREEAMSTGKKNSLAVARKTQRHPLNLRWKCTACGAEFQETKQQTELGVHCRKMAGGSGCNFWHHVLTAVPKNKNKSHGVFPVISDNVDVDKKYMD